MNITSMTYNGQIIDPKRYLSRRKYETIYFILLKTSNLIGQLTTELDIKEFQAKFSRSLHRYDQDLEISGYLSCNYDHRLQTVTIPIKDQYSGEQYTIVIKWTQMGKLPKIQILD